ncbi:hypothetical protein Hte_000525 [Hypoxylon texense]
MADDSYDGEPRNVEHVHRGETETDRSSSTSIMGPRAVERIAKCSWGRSRKISSYFSETVVGTAAGSSRAAVFTNGHVMKWNEGEEYATATYFEQDMRIVSHVLYLDIPAKFGAMKLRSEEPLFPFFRKESNKHREARQNVEKCMLRKLCEDHQISFRPVDSKDSVPMLIRNIVKHTAEGNAPRADRAAAAVRLGLTA